MDKTLNFGIEIETVGAPKQRLINAIADAIGGRVSTYPSFTATMPDGRVWKVVNDASLNGCDNGEVVSPILTYDDLPMLQSVVRAIRGAGGRIDSSCGIHVHVDASRFDAPALVRLVKLVHKQERLIEMALGIQEHRLGRYCKPIDPEFLARVDGHAVNAMSTLQRAWYGGSAQPTRYHETRYRGVNLNSYFVRGTVEFRLFEGSLHAGEVKTYVQFALALASKALRSRAAQARRRDYNLTNPKYAMRTFLLALGLIGEEFKTARFHLLKRLPGNAAWWGNGRSREAERTEPAPSAPPASDDDTAPVAA